MQRFQKRFEAQPEIPEQFLDIINKRWANQEPADVTYLKLSELLKGQPDLLERLGQFFRGKINAVPLVENEIGTGHVFYR